MDTFRTFPRRLIATLVVALAGWLLLPVGAAHADTYAVAFSKCQNYVATAYQNAPNVVCRDHGSYGVGVYNTSSGVWYPQAFTYTGTGNPCSLMSGYPRFNFAGKATNGMQVSFPTKDGNTGATVRCGYVVSVLSPPVKNQWGNWQTLVSEMPTGNPAGGAGTDGKYYNPDGGVPDPPPPDSAVPSTYPTTATNAPQVCGSGMCYDPNTDTYKYVDGVSGKEVDVPGSTVRSAAGGCASAGSSTACGGSPSAPRPPANSPITDPPTQIKSTDSFVQADPNSGQNVGVTTVVYAVPGATTSNGSKPGDTVPASASTSPSVDHGSVSGGGDCNSPPACSGDNVMCGVVREQWYTMCSAKKGTDQLHKDLAGDGSTPPSYGQHTSSEIDQGTVDVGDTSTLDSSGFGWGTGCPFSDVVVPFGDQSFTLSFQPVCDYGPWMRAFILILAGLKCAQIMAGVRDN